MTGGAPSARPQLTLQTVDRALSVLEMVAAAAELPTPRMIAEGLGLNITTTYHLVNTLCQRGYISREPDGRVRIGTQVAALHQALLRQGAFERDIRRFVEEMRAATDETCYSTRIVDDKILIEDVVEADHALRVGGLYRGLRDDLLERASSTAVLAEADDPVRKRLLAQRLGLLTPAQQEKYLADLNAELGQYHERGWSHDFEIFEPGIYVVASAFFDAGGRVAGSVATAVPQPRWHQRRGAFVGSVVATAKAISWHLGHQTGSSGGRTRVKGGTGC